MLVFYQNGANLKVKHPKMYRMPKSIEKFFKLQKVRLSFLKYGNWERHRYLKYLLCKWSWHCGPAPAMGSQHPLLLSPLGHIGTHFMPTHNCSSCRNSETTPITSSPIVKNKNSVMRVHEVNVYDRDNFSIKLY
jgi:hypothetical protein